ncbi:MAG: hypothetical protein COA41_07835 [Sphingopyxis sp.]|nr:MAG: hypothetical protein COA41_07835 [Sphingopyxis sp.]
MTDIIDGRINLESPARFAVIGAGSPSPKVLAASSDSISDLVGYFSLREAGLDQIVVSSYDYHNRNRSSFLNFFVRDDERTIDRYLAIDAYVQHPSVERLKLYSLIIDRSGIPYSKLAALDEFSQKIEDQIERLAISFESGNEEDAIYVAQMLATLVAFLLDQIEVENRIRDRRRKLRQTVLTAYVAALGIFSSMSVIIGWEKIDDFITKIFGLN